MIQSLDNIPFDFKVTHELVNLILGIDEFKGKWRMLQNISPERLFALRRVATIESVGSSTRIEGVKLSDREVETLLSNLKQYSFKWHDEEVAGYARAMELIFESWQEFFRAKRQRAFDFIFLESEIKTSVCANTAH